MAAGHWTNTTCADDRTGTANAPKSPGLRGRADRRVRGPSGPAAERPGAGSTAATARRPTPEGEYDVTYPRTLFSPVAAMDGRSPPRRGLRSERSLRMGRSEPVLRRGGFVHEPYDPLRLDPRRRHLLAGRDPLHHLPLLLAGDGDDGQPAARQCRQRQRHALIGVAAARVLVEDDEPAGIGLQRRRSR